MMCGGCGSGHGCSYGLMQCTAEHKIDRCAQCSEFPCGKINNVLSRSAEHQKKCREVCTPEEYAMLGASFFRKEKNLRLSYKDSEK